MGRWDKIEKAARKNGFVADDEVVEACGLAMAVVVVAGGGEGRNLSRHAIVVTDRTVQAIRMGAAGFKSLKEPLFTLPRDEARAQRDGAGLLISSADGSQAWAFSNTGFGHNFDGVAAALS